MGLYHALQWSGALINACLIIWLAGSALRTFFWCAANDDEMWMLAWGFVVVAWLYRLRFILGAAPLPQRAEEISSGQALAALSILLSVAAAWVRWKRRGRAW